MNKMFNRSLKCLIEPHGAYKCSISDLIDPYKPIKVGKRRDFSAKVT